MYVGRLFDVGQMGGKETGSAIDKLPFIAGQLCEAVQKLTERYYDNCKCRDRAQEELDVRIERRFYRSKMVGWWRLTSRAV